MTEKNDREQPQAELLWKYIEELKQADNPDDVHFIAVTRGECAEVVGLMETAAEAYVLARAESAPHCRREAVRLRLQAAIAATAPAAPAPASDTAHPRSVDLPRWLTAPLTGRFTGWVVAVAALVALVWFVVPRTSPVVSMPHAAALQAIPKLVDGKLDAQSSRELWAHLLECKGCMRLYEKEKAAYLQARRSRQSRLPTAQAPGRATGENALWLVAGMRLR